MAPRSPRATVGPPGLGPSVAAPLMPGNSTAYSPGPESGDEEVDVGADESRELGRQFMEVVIGKGDWDLGAKIVSPDVVMIHPSSPEPVAGFDAVKGMLLGFRAGLPDMTMTAEDVIAEGDRAVVLWRLRATHTADLFGLPPTN